jgi:hypothetical protein
MKLWPFTEFMLANFVPATVLAGFNNRGGCVLARSYLPVLAKRIPHYLQKHGPEGMSTFAHLVNIIKMIINSIRVLVVNSRLHSLEFSIDDGLTIGHRGIISITLHFWISIQPALTEYAEVYPAEMLILDELTALLDDIMSDLAYYLRFNRDFGTWTTKQLEVTRGEYVDRFVAALQDDMEKYWSMSRGHPGMVDASVVRISTAAHAGRGVVLRMADGVPTFDELMELRKYYYGGISKESLDRRLWESSDGGNSKEPRARWDKSTSKLCFADWMMESHVEQFPGVFGGIF